jgi:threonine/homoserine/homoserine lactone efflux protein
MSELVLAAPIRWGPAGSLLVTSLAIMGSPGPATLSLAAAGSAFGLRRSLGYLTGIITGTITVLIAVAAGIIAALMALPVLRPIVIAISAAYILWLAYHIATAPPLTAQAAAGNAPSFAAGMLLGLANPKGWLAIAAVFASTRIADSVRTDTAAKTAALSMMIILILTAWLIGGVSLARLLHDPHLARIINIALAAAMVGATALAVL